MLNILSVLYSKLEKDNPVCKYSTIKTWKGNVYEIIELMTLTFFLQNSAKDIHIHTHTHDIS